MMTKDGLIFEANSLKQGRLQALTRQQLQAQATQNRERRWGPPTLWYLGNVDGPRCHANQVVPATGLVDDAMTPARKKGIVGQAGSLTYFLAGVMVFQQFDDVSLMAA